MDEFWCSMSWVAHRSHHAKDNSIQCNLNNVVFRMMVGMVPFMKHSISFSFKIVNRISIDIISMKEIITSSQSLGFLKRNIKANHPQLKAMTNKALVRPQLEYASCVWDPFTAIAIKQIDMNQRRAARWVVRDYSLTSSVTSIIEDLGWRSLEQRRSYARLSLMFKIVHHLVAIPTYPFVPSH